MDETECQDPLNIKANTGWVSVRKQLFVNGDDDPCFVGLVQWDLAKVAFVFCLVFAFQIWCSGSLPLSTVTDFSAVSWVTLKNWSTEPLPRHTEGPARPPSPQMPLACYPGEHTPSQAWWGQCSVETALPILGWPHRLPQHHESPAPVHRFTLICPVGQIWSLPAWPLHHG